MEKPAETAGFPQVRKQGRTWAGGGEEGSGRQRKTPGQRKGWNSSWLLWTALLGAGSTKASHSQQLWAAANPSSPAEQQLQSSQSQDYF